MKWSQRTPCQSCPYRSDTPVGIWDKTEFENLKHQNDRQFGALFGCHNNAGKPCEQQEPCAGWLLDQKRNGMPSITLRMTLIQNADTRGLFESLDESVDCYDSVEEMVDANRGKAFPRRSRTAQRLLRKRAKRI